jgi:uncharacterized protein (TIGR00369 family)
VNHDQLVVFFEEGVPFNRLLGMKVSHLEEGFVRTRMAPNPDHVGNPALPALHGGVISTLADAAGGLAVFTSLEPGQGCSTVDLRVDYLRRGDPSLGLECETRVVRAGNRVAVTDSTVTQGERVVATVRAVYNVVSKP